MKVSITAAIWHSLYISDLCAKVSDLVAAPVSPFAFLPVSITVFVFALVFIFALMFVLTLVFVYIFEFTMAFVSKSAFTLVFVLLLFLFLTALVITYSIPCMAPHTMKVSPAPCQRPDNVNIIMKLR